MVTTYSEQIISQIIEEIIQPTTVEDLMDPIYSGLPFPEPAELLAELDIILTSIDTGTFEQARQAGLFDFHYSPWEVL